MSTTRWTEIELWRARTGYVEEPRSVSEAADSPVYQLATTYLLLTPMLIFAVHGGFSFDHHSWNSDLGAFGGGIAVAPTASETLRESVQSWLALAFCLVAMAPYSRRIAQASWRMPLLVLLPLYAIASALWSQDPGRSLRSGLSLLITTLLALYLVGRFSPRQQMELVLLTGLVVTVSSAALALLLPQFGVDHQLHEGAWQGLFTQKNVCAEATLFLMTPALALPGSGRYGQMLRTLYVALCLFLILMTQSRTGWVMSVLYLGFTFGLRLVGGLERKVAIPVAGLFVAAAVAVLQVAANDRPGLVAFLSRSESLSGRSQIWEAIATSILKQPIGGYGFDAFWSLLHGEASCVFAAAGWVVTSAHNGFLNVGLELGLVGVGLVAATFFQAFRNASMVFRPGRSSYVDWCIGIVVLTFLYNLDERTIMATQYLPWILYLVACAGLSQEVQRMQQERRLLPLVEEPL